MTKKGKDQYEDYYERAFSSADIDNIYKEGGSANITSFFQAAQNNIKDKGYEKVLHYSIKQGKKEGFRTVGGYVWNKFFRDENVTLNKSQRVIVSTGKTIDWHGKTYKGGQFMPRAYFSSRN